jgi:glycosyltransferase involved in cell wall biosynthesis
MSVITFCGDLSSTFVSRDLFLLLKMYDYSIYWVSLPKEKKRMIRYIKNLIVLPQLFFSIKKSQVLFSEFASWHSAFGVICCKILKKKSIIVVGGYDAACIPKLKYGLFAHPIEWVFPYITYKHCDEILTVAPHLKNDIMNHMHCKMNRNKIHYIPRGHDSDLFKLDRKEKCNTVLTVSNATTVNRVKLKGLDTFVKIAKGFPNIQFILIGAEGKALKYLKSISPNNVLFLGKMKQCALIPFYQYSKVYCQLSIREGIPNVLCEAMLCECIPVGTDIPGIKETIGDTGFYTEYGNRLSTTIAIISALNSSPIIGKKARKRIIYKFSDKQWGQKVGKILQKYIFWG